MRGRDRLLWVMILIAALTPLVAGQSYDIQSIDAQREFADGVRSYHNGFYGEATLSFARTVAQENSSVLARLWLARTHYAAGFQGAALEQYRILLNDSPPLPYVRNRIETITSIGNDNLLLLREPQYILAKEINGQGDGRHIFSRPAGIAVDEDINLYVSSFASQEVLQLSVNGELRRNIWKNRYLFDRPYSVVVDDQSILISEFGKDRVVRFDRNGEQEIRFNRAGIHGALSGPQYLAIDPERNMYVSDWGNQRIVKFNSNGNFIFQFSRKNIPRRPRFAPTGIVSHDEFLYIVNSINGTIIVSDKNGNYVRTIELKGTLRIEGLALFDAQRLLLAATEGIFIYNVSTEVLTRIAGTAQNKITSLAIDKNDTIYATDFNKNRILMFSPVDAIYGGLTVHTLGVDSRAFPQVTVDVSVNNRFGKPILGLQPSNFSLREGAIVQNSRLLYRQSEETPLSIMLVVPVTDQTSDIAPQLQAFVTELSATLNENDQIGLVFSGDEAIRQAELGTPLVRIRNYITEAIRNASNTADSAASPATERAFGAAVQLASSELFADGGKRAIVYIRDGATIDAPFARIDRQQLARALNTNAVTFVQIALDTHENPDDIAGFYTLTRARQTEYAQSNAVDTIVDELRGTHDGRYRLSYISTENSDFGRRYIPLSVEAALYQRSGRDEMGYYAPLN